jgi:Lon protease-like protein
MPSERYEIFLRPFRFESGRALPLTQSLLSPYDVVMQDYLPLFPLNVVLFPEMVLPLHIFEERYKDMVRECLRETEPFGVIYAHNQEIERIGCTALITEVVREYEDGKMDILTIGGNRFEVLFFDNEKSYPRGIVDPYDDTAPSALPDREEAGKLMGFYREFCRLLNQTNEAERIEASPSLENRAFQMLSRVNVSNDLKQKILVTRSERERVTTLLNYFELLIPKLQFAEQAAKRSRSNGNISRVVES